MTRGSSKFLSLGITLIIFVLLVMTGPAQAFILNLNIQNPKISQGEEIKLFVSSEKEQGENLTIQKFSLEISGPENILCEFDINGNPLEDCEGISIIKTSEDEGNYGYSYNYGYGYGYGQANKLDYELKIDTKNLLPGIYKTKIKAITNNEEFEKQGQFIIFTKDKSLQGCSFRGEKGILNIDGFMTSSNRLNVNIPLEKAVKGKGYIYSQIGEHRFSYKFEINGVISNSEEEAEILVSGKYKGDGLKNVDETSVITIDKINKKINIEGDSIDLENMNIKFMKGC